MDICREYNNNISDVSKSSLNIVDQFQEKNLRKSAVTNILVIIICLFLSLMMFTVVSTHEGPLDIYYNEPYTNYKSDANIINFFNAANRHFDDYYISDFYLENITEMNNGQLKNGFYLDLLMLDYFNKHVIFERLIFYICLLIIIIMFALPIILIGISINYLVKRKIKYAYKYFFTIFLILALLLSIFLQFIGQKPGIGTILYIALSSLCLIYSYFENINFKEKVIYYKIFIIKLVPIVSIILMVLASTTKILQSTNSILINKINGFELGAIYNTLLINNSIHYTKELIHDIFNTFNNHYYIKNFIVFIPLFSFAASILLIIPLFSEINENLSLIKKKINTVIYLWIGLGFYGLVFILTIFADIFLGRLIYISMTSSIIFVFILYFILTFYYTLIKSKHLSFSKQIKNNTQLV